MTESFSKKNYSNKIGSKVKPGISLEKKKKLSKTEHITGRFDVSLFFEAAAANNNTIVVRFLAQRTECKCSDD